MIRVGEMDGNKVYDITKSWLAPVVEAAVLKHLMRLTLKRLPWVEGHLQE